MNRQQKRDVYQGVIGVTVTPYYDNYEVNYGKMADLTKWWISNGLVRGDAALKVCSVMGEAPQLRENEWINMLKTTVDAAEGKVDIIGGTHCKDTLRTIEDLKKAHDVGVVGMQVAPPLFNDPNQDDILRYYEALSENSDIGIMVYQNHWYNYSAINAETLLKMKDFENIVCIKWASFPGCPDESMEELGKYFNLIENGNDRVGFHKRGGDGFLDKTAVAYPPHDLQLWKFLEQKKYSEAQELWDTEESSMKEITAKIGANSGGQARMKKALMNVMGHEVGEQRPPTLPISESERSELRSVVIGLGWLDPNC
ncbi:MAG: dihydrodipicolinate synthase family protein [SAR202 cluster bacterium]|jgi:4-hydroxy-tetrahydrodipicolinate synthase|nr:dihydrodipicolinate synthase family protein [SAR202 cluster bacterium]